MSRTTLTKTLAWWPALLAPAAITLVLLARDTRLGDLIRAHDSGPIPPLLTLSAAAFALAGALYRRNPLLWVLAALGLLFFLREASVPGSDDHLPFIKKGVYVGLAGLAVWTFAWRERIGPWVRSARVLPAAAVMWGMYILSQTIARGGLKALSDVLDAQGRKMRTPMEESCETLGHLLLLGIVIASCLTPRPRGDAPPPAADESG